MQKKQLNNTADKSNKLLHALILIIDENKFFKQKIYKARVSRLW